MPEFMPVIIRVGDAVQVVGMYYIPNPRTFIAVNSKMYKIEKVTHIITRSPWEPVAELILSVVEDGEM